MKVDFGIHISYASASIARMIDGQPTIIKTNVLKDKIPLCVGFNKKGNLLVGDSAYNALRRTSNIKDINFEKNNSANYYSGFLRTIGTNETYYSSNTNQEYSSEQLLGFVIRALRSFVKDSDVKASVITVPNEFGLNQIEAIRKAGMLGGLEQVEIVQESIAALLTVGLDSAKYNNFSIIFSFQEQSFEVSLLKNGQIIDTEGNRFLGGVNLDYTIVDNIIIPQLEANFEIHKLLHQENERQKLRHSLKYYAEEAKIKLSTSETYEILTDFGDLPSADDEGMELEIDLSISRNELKKVLAPLFQSAIDITTEVIKRNNLELLMLDKFTLLGGDTLSPILKKMISNQLCPPDTSVDPKTAFTLGAALYSSTVKISENIKKYSHDKTKIHLEIGYEPTTVEDEEFITLKILNKESITNKSETIYAIVERKDKTWSSPQIEISNVGEVVEVPIRDKAKNLFLVSLFSNSNKLDAEPNEFVIQKTGGITNATLPYNIGTEVIEGQTGRIVFKTIKGLEKNKSIPAIGSFDGIKTEKEIRPGVETDCIKIPIYEGDYISEGTKAIYNEHVFDIQINGTDLPCLLPKHSDIDLTIKVDRSRSISVTAYFPAIDFTTEINTIPTSSTIESNWLANEIRKAKESINRLNQGIYSDKTQLQKIDNELESLDASFKQKENDIDTKAYILSQLRKILKVIDAIELQVKSNNPSLIEVEDLLFELFENETIESSVFQKHFDIIFEMKKENNPDLDILNEIYKELKTLPNNV